MDIAAAHAVGGTDWDALTAVGTIALALVTLAAIVTTIVITGQDRTRAAAQLKAERTAADERLDRQLEHSAAQLRDERDHAVREQREADAWAVRVRFAEVRTSMLRGAAPGDLAGSLVVTVVNLGTRTITRVKARFSPDGEQLVSHRVVEHLPTEDAGLGPREETSGYGDVLAPGMAVQIASIPVAPSHLTGPYPVVRWTDVQGQRWEHRKGEVRRVGVHEEWLP